jgi:hypothetical protein
MQSRAAACANSLLLLLMLPIRCIHVDKVHLQPGCSQGLPQTLPLVESPGPGKAQIIVGMVLSILYGPLASRSMPATLHGNYATLDMHAAPTGAMQGTVRGSLSALAWLMHCVQSRTAVAGQLTGSSGATAGECLSLSQKAPPSSSSAATTPARLQSSSFLHCRITIGFRV